MKHEALELITLRCTVRIRVFFLVVAGLLTWGAAREFSRGNLFTKAAWSVLAIMGVVAMAESLVGRIELRSDSLTIVGPLERRVYARDRILRLKAEWKAGLFVELADNSWVKLEAIGFMGKQAIPTLRAWLRKTGPRQRENHEAAQQGVEADEARSTSELRSLTPVFCGLVWRATQAGRTGVEWHAY